MEIRQCLVFIDQVKEVKFSNVTREVEFFTASGRLFQVSSEA